jgi:hypothetical protein
VLHGAIIALEHGATPQSMARVVFFSTNSSGAREIDTADEQRSISRCLERTSLKFDPTPAARFWDLPTKLLGERPAVVHFAMHGLHADDAHGGAANGGVRGSVQKPPSSHGPAAARAANGGVLVWRDDDGNILSTWPPNDSSPAMGFVSEEEEGFLTTSSETVFVGLDRFNPAFPQRRPDQGSSEYTFKIVAYTAPDGQPPSLAASRRTVQYRKSSTARSRPRRAARWGRAAG